MYHRREVVGRLEPTCITRLTARFEELCIYRSNIFYLNNPKFVTWAFNADDEDFRVLTPRNITSVLMNEKCNGRVREERHLRKTNAEEAKAASRSRI